MEQQVIRYSARASLVTIGMQFCRLNIWTTVGEHVKIKQKVLKHTPLDKLLDCLINILAGGTGLVEINTRVRPDQAIQRAFGRTGCAEQSTISDTLNACTIENVNEMRKAVETILKKHSQSYHHEYQATWQLLDVDVTGMPAGRLGQGVTKGYFAKQMNRRGRQLGRVLATWYEEIVVDRLYNGKRQLDTSLPELVTDAETVLDLDLAKRKRTILRVDGGGGDDDNINWILEQDYHLLIKVKNWRRAQKLASSVTRWYPDPKVMDREVGWVEKPHLYARPTRHLALRKRKANGQWSYHALVFTPTDEMLFHLCGQTIPASPEPPAVLFAALHAYDLRSGGIETQNRGDKQGLGLSRRNKHLFEAQEMLVLLAQIAHNLVIWTRNELAQADPRLRKYGIQRTVRDVLQIPGYIRVDCDGNVDLITLSQEHPLAPVFQKAFAPSLAADDLSLILGQI
jgi:hypothetical protein